MNDERREAFEAWCVHTERYGSDFETWQAAIAYMESRLDSDDVVEKVARAIYDAIPAYYSGTTTPVPWEDAAPPYKDDTFREAEAALQALKGSIWHT